MADLRIEQVSKRFGPKQALSRVNLDVHHGEFLTLLGPSGSGKSTLLRLVAGLETPDEGRILIGGEVVCAEGRWTPPQRRGTGMVFQNYALWPHMTAAENVAFPLGTAGIGRREAAGRVRDVLELMELGPLAGKRPGDMSGGEQQRVALARALVGRPAILLMDECLSNLDLRLREKMAGELRRVQESLSVTTLYVTHDQHEAFALSDRIAVIQDGRIRQIGPPGELYRHPRNPQVAEALGPINLLDPADAQRTGLSIPRVESLDGRPVLGIRPDRVRVATRKPESTGAADFQAWSAGRVTRVTQTASGCQCRVDVGGCTLEAAVQGSGAREEEALAALATLAASDAVWISIDPDDWIVMARESQADA